LPPSARTIVRRPTAATREALAGVAGVTEVTGSWHDALAAVDAQTDAEWLWLVEGDAVPQDGALDALLAVAEDHGDLPAPALVAGRVLGADGTIDPGGAPWIPLLDRVTVIDAARRRLVSLRLARWGSLLVHRDVLARHGLPREDFARGGDDLEWTARILRDERGYLAPASVSRRAAAPRRPITSAAEIVNRARMVRGDAWTGPEPVWFAFMLFVDLARAARRP
jgi:hypothetical protein